MVAHVVPHGQFYSPPFKDKSPFEVNPKAKLLRILFTCPLGSIETFHVLVPMPQFKLHPETAIAGKLTSPLLLLMLRNQPATACKSIANLCSSSSVPHRVRITSLQSARCYRFKVRIQICSKDNRAAWWCSCCPWLLLQTCSWKPVLGTLLWSFAWS